MADTAIFSSFRRLGPSRSDPPTGQPASAAVEPPPSFPAAIVEVDTPEILEPAPATPGEMNGASAAIASTEESFPGPWQLSGVGLGADQLGLAHPDVIMLQAKLRGTAPIGLEAHTAGIYRPPGFRPAPWSGFAYDQLDEETTGLAAGTRILTARGEVEVERLVSGDMAMALRGPALLPISWIGRTSARVARILIEPGALGPDIPRRFLCLGRDQGIFLGPAPVAASTLVNGTTIRHAEADATDLFLIDVGQDEIILAEGLALASSRGANRRR